MSLDNIQLPPITVQYLYTNTLVSNAEKESEPSFEKNALSFLGGNSSNVIILVNSNNATYLPDAELNFLTGILNACKLNLDDVAIVNVFNYADINHKKISSQLKAKVVLLFGVSSQEIDLPFTIPEFQIQTFNSQKYITAPSLNILQSDVELKKKLWSSLKEIFL